MPGPVLDVILRTVGRVLGRVIPDADQLEQAKAELERMALQGELQIEELAVERLRIAAGDRADARDREKAVRDWAPPFLACGAFVLLACLIVGLFFLEPPAANSPILHNLVGLLEGAFLTVFTYYFGSSAGSRRKQSTIDRTAERATDRATERVQQTLPEEMPRQRAGRIGW